MHKSLIALFFILLIAGCVTKTGNKDNGLIDTNATDETVALFHNLKQRSKNHVLFGHQHATEYGHGWRGEQDRSDVKSVTGDHPAVIGIDLMGFP